MVGNEQNSDGTIHTAALRARAGGVDTREQPLLSAQETQTRPQQGTCLWKEQIDPEGPRVGQGEREIGRGREKEGVGREGQAFPHGVISLTPKGSSILCLHLIL